MKRILIRCAGVLLIVQFFISEVSAQDRSAFLKKIFVSMQGDSMNYRILYPENYNKRKKYPVVLFLHGAGERGSDNEKQLVHGSDLFLKPLHRYSFPAIVIFPQCPEDKYWIDINIRPKLHAGEDLDFNEVNSPPVRELVLAKELLEYIIETEEANKKRVYVIGLSMGSFGTYEIITRWPDMFAGAVAICGGGNVDRTKDYAKKVPIWITHGLEDDVVNPIFSRRVYEALKAQGADVKYTEFPEANHNAWDPTFAMPELLPWLFSKKK